MWDGEKDGETRIFKLKADRGALKEHFLSSERMPDLDPFLTNKVSKLRKLGAW